MVSSMSNYEKVRELNEISKLKRSKITFKKIGHSSKDTSKRLLDMYKRIEIITRQLKELSQKNEGELQDMLIQMLPTLKHNINVFLNRSRSKEFQKTLEAELWK